MPVEVRASHPSGRGRRSLRRLAAVLGLCAALFAATGAEAASVAAVSQNDGYSGHVMDKILAVWAPPAVSGERQFRLCVSLDGDGRVSECKAVRPSGVPALDASGCAAVREAAPFGTPPYGMPLDVYFSFWTGQPRGKAPVPAAAADPAAQPAQPARAVQATPADSHAQAAALAAATATGGATAATASAKPAASASSGSARAQDKYDARFQKYISKVVWKLRNAMYIPAQTRPGTYHATAQVRYNSAGTILDASLLKGSGDAMLDKYVLQGIRRAGSVPTPPAGLGDTLDLTFTLTRQ